MRGAGSPARYWLPVVLVWQFVGTPVSADPVNLSVQAVSARALALGGSGTAIGRDPDMVWINPAAPALLTDPGVTFANQRGFFHDTAWEALGTWQTGFGTAVLGGAVYDTGLAVMRATDGVDRTFTGQRDLMGTAGLSAPLGEFAEWGLLAKFLHSTLAERFKTAALLGECGVQVRATNAVKIGAALQNFGGSLKYPTLPNPPSSRIRVGTATGTRPGLVRSGDAPGDSLLATLDGIYLLSAGRWTGSAGLEYRIGDFLALRSGWRIGRRSDLGGLSAGLGFGVGHYRIDYSIAFAGGPAGSPQIIALTAVIPYRR